MTKTSRGGLFGAIDKIIDRMIRKQSRYRKKHNHEERNHNNYDQRGTYLTMKNQHHSQNRFRQHITL